MKYSAMILLILTLFSCGQKEDKPVQKEKKELGDFKKSKDLPKCDCADLKTDSIQDIKNLEGKPFTGICMSYYPDDSTKVMEEVQYLDGKIHGYYRIYSKEKVILTEDQYVNGKKQALERDFICDCDELEVEELGSDGIRTFLLKGVKFTGVCEKFSKDGKIKILDMQFKEGLRHGNSLYYDQYGEPITADVYREGKFVKTIVYTKDEEPAD